jgi:hypothetical protein
MNQALKYRSYPQLVNEEIARSKNFCFFSDLKIPRTIFLYCVKKLEQE